MTNENDEALTVPDDLPTNYLKFQVPGFPYSVVSVPLTDEWIRHGVASARLVADLLTEAFPENGQPDDHEYTREPYPERNDAPRGRQEPRQGGSRPSGGQTANRYGITLKCPDHGDVLVPSTRNKDMDWIEDIGKEIPASWFHSLPDGKTHTVYQSKAVWA